MKGLAVQFWISWDKFSGGMTVSNRRLQFERNKALFSVSIFENLAAA
jgi:hypothetical protein